eukprot:254806-Amphidinium_carterae.1
MHGCGQISNNARMYMFAFLWLSKAGLEQVLKRQQPFQFLRAGILKLGLLLRCRCRSLASSCILADSTAGFDISVTVPDEQIRELQCAAC